jgi:anaerobic magnesium-protoporphyrin IX monomethyl ester cyclase
MNVLLLNPPYHPRFSRSQRSPAVIKSGVMYYPIWLAYATGVLARAGFTVKLIDAPAAGLDLPQVLNLLDDFTPRLVVIDTSTPSIKHDLEVVRAIKSRAPEVFVVLVGPHVSALPAATLLDCQAVDAVARREYDYTVRELAQTLDGGGEFSAILGLSYRAGDGQIVHNPDRPWIKDVDALPFVSEVYQQHLRIENYFYSITRYPEVAIVAGRGCPHGCTYCVWPQTLTGRGYRRRSVVKVADEFEFIARELPQVKEVFIEDDTLTINQEYAISLAKELIRRGNRLPFSANSRADVDYETLRWLKQAGLRLLCVGFESGDQAVLDNINKRIRVEQFREFRAAARRSGVLVHGCFMAGNPGETRATLAKTLELAKQLNPDTAQFFPLMVYPGTAAYDLARRDGSLATDDFDAWLTPDGLHRCLVQYSDLSSADLVAWCDEARRAFYLRPRYVLGKVWEITTHPGEAKRIMKAGSTFSRYLLRSSRKT